MIVVCNSTPLILLSRLSDFILLKNLYHKIFIPLEVYNEVAKKGKVGEKELKQASNRWIEIKTGLNQNRVQEFKEKFGIGEGESAAIILAQELKADFIFTDDKVARKSANIILQGTPTMVSGTLGILRFAVEKRIISKIQFKSKIEFLRQEGFYLKEELYRQMIEAIDQ